MKEPQPERVLQNVPDMAGFRGDAEEKGAQQADRDAQHGKDAAVWKLEAMPHIPNHDTLPWLWSERKPIRTSGLANMNSDKSLVRTKMLILSYGTEIAYKLKGNYLKNLWIRATAPDFKSS